MARDLVEVFLPQNDRMGESSFPTQGSHRVPLAAVTGEETRSPDEHSTSMQHTEPYGLALYISPLPHPPIMSLFTPSLRG